jgi:cephalosporin hydroxylase
MSVFDWLGLPIIQVLQDVVAVREVGWRVRPKAIVETGVASGGLLVLSASTLQLIVGIDIHIDIRHNREGRRVLVVLDSGHMHEHVCAKLRLYSSLVDGGSYPIDFDTAVDQMPTGFMGSILGAGNNPRTAVRPFIQETDRCKPDLGLVRKLLLTCNPDGCLRCITNP